MDYKYYKLQNNDDLIYDNSELSLALHSVTGFYSNDYINPVKKPEGELITIISDESEFKNNFCVSLVILPFLDKSYLINIENRLENLVNEYNINNIHFTDIFGKKNILGNKKSEFLKKYSDIVSEIPMSCLSISKNKEEILLDIKKEDASYEEIYYSLFWSNFERVMTTFPDNYIYHISLEQEYDMNNPKKYEENARVTFNKLYWGIEQLYNMHPDKYISICKHPSFFSKRALLYSSLADMVAYASNKIQQKIDSQIPISKIQKQYKPLLIAMKKIFQNYSGLSSEMLIELINKMHTL